MIKFTRSTKKKLEKVRSGGSSSSTPLPSPPPHAIASAADDHTGKGGSSSPPPKPSRRRSKSRDISVSSRSDYTAETGYSSTNNNGGHPRASSRPGSLLAASTASISSASVFLGPSGAPAANHREDAAGVTCATSTASPSSTTPYGLQPSSSARLLHDKLNHSARSSLLSSLGNAASKTFRSYKMTLPRCPGPPPTWNASISSMGGSGSGGAIFERGGGAMDGASNEDEITLESDLELLGRTVHAVSSALTEPPKDTDRFIIYDVSFNPKGCVWDALIVVQLKDDENDDNEDGGGEEEGGSSGSGGEGGGGNSSSRRHRERSSSRHRSSTRGTSSSSRQQLQKQQRHRSSSRQHHGSTSTRHNRDGRSSSRHRSLSRQSKRGSVGYDDSMGLLHGKKTFSFPIRVTCAEDDSGGVVGGGSSASSSDRRGGGPHHHPKRAKTYAVDLAVIDDMPHHPISSWTTSEAAEHRDDIKNAMEWVSYGIRRSMARSMFPVFPEGCQGRPFREVYQLNKKLKSGTFSTVCRGVHRATGRQVAVKCILRKKIEPSVDAAVFEEVLIMSGLHHRYICPMIDYFEEDRCHFVVMELEKGGDLCERLNEKVTYSEPDARTVLRNICEAMDFVHSKGFAHCDIKPRNYLLRSKRDDVDVRLADFGFAQHVHAPNSLTSQCGTPFFVAPEVINRKPYDQKVDMWSIGITTYLLLSGETPFNGKNRQQLFRRISCDEPIFPDDKWGNVSDEAIDFVLRLLTKDPAKRMSASEALRHEWIVGSGAKALMNASMATTSEDLSEVTYHSKKSRDPPPQATTNKKSPSANHRPPPPPKLSSRRGDHDADENARLLDVIKEQDAKIEKLEAMVKRMLEPEGVVP